MVLLPVSKLISVLNGFSPPCDRWTGAEPHRSPTRTAVLCSELRKKAFSERFGEDSEVGGGDENCARVSGYGVRMRACVGVDAHGCVWCLVCT